MKQLKRARLGHAALAALLLAFGIFMWPARLGGDMYYVMLTGPSMEPHFHLGDLVLVRRASVYQPGEAVLYMHPKIGFVFHRIAGFDKQGRFILRGDNNAWDDPYHPSREEIMGVFVARVPRLGQMLQSIRTPGVIALLVVLSAVFLFTAPADEDETLP